MKRFSVCLSLSAVLLASATVLGAPAHADVPTCHGQPATLVVTSGQATGTEGDDVVVASGYGTRVTTGAGDDLVCLVGQGTPFVDTGRGDDVVDATGVVADDSYPHAALGAGSDTYIGGDARDFVDDTGAGPGHDVVSTGAGRDRVFVGASRVDVSLGDDQDEVVVSSRQLGGGRLDLGSANNRLRVEQPGRRVDLDLPRHRLQVGDERFRIQGAEVADVVARRARLVGDGQRQIFSVQACTATVVGGAQGDVLGYDGRGACAHPTAHLYGGKGADRLLSEGGRVVLVGGPGEDRATGRSGVVTCQAEHRRGCRP